MKHLYKGDTWTPTFTISQKDSDGNKSYMDLTNYTVKMFWRKQLAVGEALLTLTASYSDRSGGKGYFELTHTDSKALDLGIYYREIKLYHTVSQTLVKTFMQGPVSVEVVLVNQLT